MIEPESSGGREPSALGRAMLDGMLGFVSAFVLGVALMGVLWLVVFARAIAGEPTPDVPGLVTVLESGATVSTVVGPLAVFGPLVLGTVGAVAAIAAGHMHRRARARRSDGQGPRT